MIDKIRDKIYDFFVESNDFNGIPLRQISNEFDIGYKESIDLIKVLVQDGIVFIQSSTNPHIIRHPPSPIENQLKVLEDAIETTVSSQKLESGEGTDSMIDGLSITINVEDTGFPICLYPSKKYLQDNRDLSKFGNAVYTKELALGESQLKPIFFDIEVLERYSNDPRFDFKFEDYSGDISCKYDENHKPIVREEDQIFLKSFGYGFDSDRNRLAVVFLRYLKNLTNDHQVFWASKEVKDASCKVLAEYYDNMIRGRWIFPRSIFTGFIGELNCLNELSETCFGIKLFRKSFDEGNRPKEFTVFFMPTLKNYHAFVSLLDKMVSENINKGFFDGKIELFDIEESENGVLEKKRKGTLRLFEEWLLSMYNVDDQELLKEYFRPLKKIRKERQSPAHKISENGIATKNRTKS